MRDDLQYNLCDGCGELSPDGRGIIAMVTHACPKNTYTYRIPVGMSFLRMFKEMISAMQTGRGPLASFYDLISFPYLKAMPNYETASYMDKFIYSECRDLEIREMKRLRAYIELEEEFNTKW